MHRQVPHNELPAGVLLHLHLGQVEERCRCMRLVQQIVAILVVNLQVADVHLELVSRVLPDVLENVRQGSRNDATISVTFRASSYREGLSRTSLSVGENCAIVALETPIDHILGDLIKDSFLLRQHVKDACELEDIVVVLDLGVPQSVALEIELYLSVVGRQRQARIWLLSRAYAQVHLNSLLFRRHCYIIGSQRRWPFVDSLK